MWMFTAIGVKYFETDFNAHVNSRRYPNHSRICSNKGSISSSSFSVDVAADCSELMLHWFVLCSISTSISISSNMSSSPKPEVHAGGFGKIYLCPGRRIFAPAPRRSTFMPKNLKMLFFSKTCCFLICAQWWGIVKKWWPRGREFGKNFWPGVPNPHPCPG